MTSRVGKQALRSLLLVVIHGNGRVHDSEPKEMWQGKQLEQNKPFYLETNKRVNVGLPDLIL